MGWYFPDCINEVILMSVEARLKVYIQCLSGIVYLQEFFIGLYKKIPDTGNQTSFLYLRACTWLENLGMWVLFINNSATIFLYEIVCTCQTFYIMGKAKG